MAYLPKTRKFDGETFRLHDDYLFKNTANWDVLKLRSRGWRVRLVRLMGLYGVYKRR